jgi:hypothetical protein
VTKSVRHEEERQAKQAAYVVHVSLSDTGVKTEQGFVRLEPGMAVTAEIRPGSAA